MSELAYFRTRLALANRATMLAPQSRYNLAASTVDDDALEQAVAQFGGPQPGEGGFGIADITNEFLSRDPKYLAVNDISELQANLVSTGYLPPNFQATGVYDPVTNAAFQRQERDGMDLIRAGQHFAAVPVRKFFEYMGYTVPSGIVKSAVGVGKGIVEDFTRTITNPVEALEEGGAVGGAAIGVLGGAAIGAGIGAAGGPIGAGAGALIGGIVTGVGGFFADLFGDDEEEEDQDGFHAILDALTPVDEISSGQAKNFFAALSTVMTASAVLKGVSLARSGVQAATGATRVAAAEAGRTPLRQAFQLAGRSQVEPGMVAKLAQSGIRHPAFGGAISGGTIDALPELLSGNFGDAASDFVRGAAIGAVAGPLAKKLAPKGVTDKALKALDAAPLARVTSSGAGKVAQAVYTGASVSAIGGRLAGELPGTGVRKGLEEADDLDLGVGAHVADWTLGLALYPTRLLPWRGDDMSRAVKALSSDNLLLPFAEAARRLPDGSVTSLRKGMERAKTMMGAHPVTGRFDLPTLQNNMTWSYVQKGLDDEVTDLLATRQFTQGARSWAEKEAVFGEERSNLIRQIYEEMGASDDLTASVTARRLFEKGTDNLHSMRVHVETFEGRGSLLDNFAAHRRATDHLTARSRQVEGVNFTPAVRDDPTNGVTGYQTREHFQTAADDYENAATAYKEAFENALTDTANPALIRGRTEAGARLEDVLTDMRRRGFIDEGEYATLRPGGPEPVVKTKIANELREIAKTRPFEVKSETLRMIEETGNNRYIALSTGENILGHFDLVPKWQEISGVAEYSRVDGLRDALASIGTKVDRADAGKMRFNSIVHALEQVSQRHGLDVDGSYIANTLYDALKSRYDPEFALRQGERLTVGRVKVKRVNERTGEVTKEWFKIDPRDLSIEDIHEALHLDTLAPEAIDSYHLANEIKKGLHVGAAWGADIAHPIATARNLGRAMKVNGLPAFNDFMRTAHVPLERFPGDSELAKRFAKKGDYGYVGHNLRRAHLALQFSLSPTFDASRYMEAMTFGKMNDIPVRFALAPNRSIRKGTFKSPYRAEPVTGNDAYQDMIRFGDEVFHGRPVMQNFDEIQLRASHSGILGFKPRETEYAHALVLAQRKLKNKATLDAKDLEDIRETVLQIHQYGAKQTAFGNSMHFVFFPYLFVGKQLRQIQDFTLGAPVRNLLVHEGVRRWNTLVNENQTLGEKFAEDFKQHVPLAKELARLNNLSYGISAGRFFLEGVMDKEGAGKVSQALASFFLPGGVHQPMQDAAGASADALKHFFVPVVLVDDGKLVRPTDEIGNVIARLAPIYRDIDRWFFENEYGGQVGPLHGVVGETVSTLTEGMNPMAQFQELLDFKRMEGQTLDALAVQAGYASWDSLAGAHPELRDTVNQINRSVEAQFPSGSEMANEFQNSDRAKDQALYAIQTKGDLTPAEEAIAFIGTMERQAKVLAAQVDITQEEALRMVAPIVRSYALQNSGNRQFQMLWQELFQPGFGPLRRVA